MTKKIVVEIAEGLGNQLFMYAFAYSLSKKINYDLMIDRTSGYSKKKNLMRKHQKYMLDNLNINQDYASKNDVYDNNFKRFIKKIEIFFDNFFNKKKFIIEKYIKINKKKVSLNIPPINIKNLSKNLYIQGHFEDENYFKTFRNDFLKMYKPLNKYLTDNEKIISKLKNTNSVSIHIRQHRFTEQVHEKKSKFNNDMTIKFTNELIEYIKKSVFFFEKNLDNPEFFIWSNDFSGINQHFDSKKFNYIIGNDVINDFNLFSYAKHFIVGGSTFHWWGAWLNENPNKVCVCPHNLNPSGNNNFYPKEWLRI